MAGKRRLVQDDVALGHFELYCRPDYAVTKTKTCQKLNMLSNYLGFRVEGLGFRKAAGV